MTTPRRIICSILSGLLLSSCALGDPPKPQRTVRVKVLADPRLRELDPRWVEGAKDLIEGASDYFEREFGIRLVAKEIGPLVLDERISSTAQLLVWLKEKVPLRDRNGSYDLIIGLTGERVSPYLGGRGRVDRIGDCRRGLGNYVASSLSSPFRYHGPDAEPDLDLLVLVHELGHIFGAEHTKEAGSIMYEDFDYRTEFDEKSRETILKNKFCPFGKG